MGALHEPPRRGMLIDEAEKIRRARRAHWLWFAVGVWVFVLAAGALFIVKGCK